MRNVGLNSRVELPIRTPATAQIVLERTLCGVALLALAPLLLVLASIILLQSGAPVLFCQRRIGRFGRPFILLKFRTMRRASGACITVSSDPRITPVGRVLRRYRLDELPQLWNVIRGDMTLVGLRPEVSDFVDLKLPVWRAVLQVRPGITGPATILYQREEELLSEQSDPVQYYREVILPRKLAISSAYLRERSLWCDIALVLLTLRCMLFRRTMDVNRSRLAIPFGESA